MSFLTTFTRAAACAALGCVLCTAVEAQYFQHHYGNALDNAFTKVIPHGPDYYVIGRDQPTAGALARATVARINGSGQLQWVLRLDLASQWNDAVLTPSGNLMMVGNTLPFDANSQSLMAIVTPLGALLSAQTFDVPGRDWFNRIVSNPIPDDPAFPYYVLGGQWEGGTTPATWDDIVLLTFNDAGVIGWKKIYKGLFGSTDDEFARDLRALPDGSLILGGNSGMGGVLFRGRNTGDIENSVGPDGVSFSFADVAPVSNGFVAIGHTFPAFTAYLMKFDADLLDQWQVQLPLLTAVRNVWQADSSIYVSGSAPVSGLTRGVVLRFLDAPGGPVLRWIKYLHQNETAYSGGTVWPVSSAQVAYADGRTKPDGFGGECAFLSVSDPELNTCMTLTAMPVVSISNLLFNSPVGPNLQSASIPIPTNITSQHTLIGWQQAVACHSVSISGTVYRECGGQPYANQPVLSGWTVQLLDTAGQLIAVQQTDTAGGYRFGDLPAMPYLVRIALLPGWTPKVPITGEYLVDGRNTSELRSFGVCPGCSCDDVHFEVVQAPGNSDTCEFVLAAYNDRAYCFSAIDIALSAGVFEEIIPADGWDILVIDSQHVRLSPPKDDWTHFVFHKWRLRNVPMSEMTVSTSYNVGQGDVVCSKAFSVVCPRPVSPMPCCPPGSYSGAELVQNGDFEQGNLGFTSSYIYLPPGNSMPVGRYSVLNASEIYSANNQWACLDHTASSPTGRMLVVDGYGGPIAWQQTVNVTAGTTYAFSAWFNNLVRPPKDYNDPQVALFVDNTLIAGPLILPETPDRWQWLCDTFRATATGSVTLSIRMLSTANLGNDLAIDDISFRACSRFPCLDDFENGSTASWTALNGSLSVITDPITGSKVLKGNDNSGPSWMYNNSSNYSGVWTQKFNHHCLCFDVRYDKGNSQNPSTMTNAITLYQGSNPFTAARRATFVVNTPIGNTWTRVCVPIQLSNGISYPANSYGQWTSTSPADFDIVMQGASGIGIALDVGPNPSEMVFLDDFCIEKCSLCPSECEANRIDLSTGATPVQTGNYLPPGGHDPMWMLISAPPNAGIPASVSSPQPANLVGAYLGWATPPSTWISAVPLNNYGNDNCTSGPQTCACPPFVYQRIFCVCERTEAHFQFNFYSDNNGKVELWEETSSGNFIHKKTLADNCPNLNAVTNFTQPLVVNTIEPLQPGRYALRISHWNVSGGPMGVNLYGTVSGPHLEHDTCCSPPRGNLCVTKYHDRNCDSTWNITANAWTSSEPGLPNWLFQLVGGGASQSGTTHQQGQVCFTGLTPGIYTISETLQTGWVPSNPAGGSTPVTVNPYSTTTVTFGNCTNNCDCGPYSFLYSIGKGPLLEKNCGDVLFVPNDLPFQFIPSFSCHGNCAKPPTVDYVLTGPPGFTTLSANGVPIANLPIVASTFTIPGTYQLTLAGHCDSKLCPCTLTFHYPADCCKDYQNFLAHLQSHVSISVDNANCKATLTIGALPVCDSLLWVNWGDGSPVVNGPFGANTMLMHTYASSGAYVVSYAAIERDPITGQICFDVAVRKTIFLSCADSWCPFNFVKNGDFEVGTPTSLDQDICNALCWCGIWTGGSTGDYYSTTPGMGPPGTMPVPASQGKFGAMWCRKQGTQRVWREGIMNELQQTIPQSSGCYELEFKIACTGFYFGTPILSAYGVYAPNGLASAPQPIDGANPSNLNLYPPGATVLLGSHTIPPTCNNNFLNPAQKITFLFNANILPATGITHIFFTRDDQTDGGVYLAIDDVCFRKDVCPDSCCKDFTAFSNRINNAVSITASAGTYQFTISNTLLSCDYIDWINWGDGSPIQQGPFQGGSSITHTYNTSGPYTITYLAIEKDLTTGLFCFEKVGSVALVNVKDIWATRPMRLYPNPTPGHFTLELPAPAPAGMTLRIADPTGRLLLEIDALAGNERQQVQAYGLPAGFYVVQAVHEGRVVGVSRFVKQ